MSSGELVGDDGTSNGLSGLVRGVLTADNAELEVEGTKKLGEETILSRLALEEARDITGVFNVDCMGVGCGV